MPDQVFEREFTVRVVIKQNGVAVKGHPVERCSLTEALAHDV